MTENPTFVHLTDLHVGAPGVEDPGLYSDTSSTLRAILAEVKKLQPKPKFIMASGDLTNRGDVASYHQLKQIFDEAELGIPVLFGLGNHDTRAGFYEGMLGRTDDLGAPYFHDAAIGGIHAIMLDSSTPRRVGGTIEPEQFAWLAEALDRHPELPKVIAVHHAPALDDHNPDMEWESLSFADTAKLKDMLAGRQNVIGMFCGHIHYDRVSNWYGIPVIVGIGQHMAT
ncbi:MAG TPA: metallophosphoesterase, partial [Devosia sp.]|nr:metallophosphoesterase [Devosia sp.]